MGTTKNSPPKDKTFTIIVSAIVVVMLAIVSITIFSGKKVRTKETKIEISPQVSVTASIVNGKTGPDKLTVFSDTTTDNSIGSIVPTFSAQDFADKRVTVAPEGKPYVIAFVAHWCPHCQKEVPRLVSLYKDGKVPKNVTIFAVATGTDKTKPNYPPSTWLFDEGWPWAKMADSKDGLIGSSFGLSGYPFLVYVNADGTVAARTSGESKDEDVIAKLKAISNSKNAK